jgi:hypothetical protein
VAEAAVRLKVPGVALGIYLRGAEDYVYHGITSVENPLEVNLVIEGAGKGGKGNILCDEAGKVVGRVLSGRVAYRND